MVRPEELKASVLRGVRGACILKSPSNIKTS